MCRQVVSDNERLPNQSFTFSVLLIYPINTSTRKGYKTANDTPCVDTKGDQYISCMENETFSFDDIFPFGGKHFQATPFYPDNTHGLVQLVTINSGVLSTSSAKTLNIKMNPNMSYFIVVTDPKLQFISNNPKIVPRTVLKFSRNAGFVNLFMEVIIKK